MNLIDENKINYIKARKESAVEENPEADIVTQIFYVRDDKDVAICFVPDYEEMFQAIHHGAYGYSADAIVVVNEAFSTAVQKDPTGAIEFPAKGSLADRFSKGDPDVFETIVISSVRKDRETGEIETKVVNLRYTRDTDNKAVLWDYDLSGDDDWTQVEGASAGGLIVKTITEAIEKPGIHDKLLAVKDGKIDEAPPELIAAVDALPIEGVFASADVATTAKMMESITCQIALVSTPDNSEFIRKAMAGAIDAGAMVDYEEFTFPDTDTEDGADDE